MKKHTCLIATITALLCLLLSGCNDYYIDEDILNSFIEGQQENTDITDDDWDEILNSGISDSSNEHSADDENPSDESSIVPVISMIDEKAEETDEAESFTENIISEEPEDEPVEEPEAVVVDEPKNEPIEEPESVVVDEPNNKPVEEHEALVVDETETKVSDENEAAVTEQHKAEVVEATDTVPVIEKEAEQGAKADTEAEEAITDESASELYVWIPKSGSKYHSNPSCSNMKNPSNVSLNNAQSQGYTACKKCY